MAVWRGCYTIKAASAAAKQSFWKSFRLRKLVAWKSFGNVARIFYVLLFQGKTSHPGCERGAEHIYCLWCASWTVVSIRGIFTFRAKRLTLIKNEKDGWQRTPSNKKKRIKDRKRGISIIQGTHRTKMLLVVSVAHRHSMRWIRWLLFHKVSIPLSMLLAAFLFHKHKFWDVVSSRKRL